MHISYISPLSGWYLAQAQPDLTAKNPTHTSGNMVWTRPAFGGNLMAMILCPDNRPQLGTVRPGVFKKPELVEGKEGTITREDIHVAADQIRTKLIERIEGVVQLLTLKKLKSSYPVVVV